MTEIFLFGYKLCKLFRLFFASLALPRGVRRHRVASEAGFVQLKRATRKLFAEELEDIHGPHTWDWISVLRLDNEQIVVASSSIASSAINQHQDRISEENQNNPYP